MPDRSPKREVSPVTQLKAYPTRLDRFRITSGIDLPRWLDALGMTRAGFTPLRAGRDVTLETAARVVRAAGRVLGRALQPSELFDFGEDTPPGAPEPGRHERRRHTGRENYDTPLERLLEREELRPALVARQAGITRQAFLSVRAGRASPRVSTIRKVIAALRQLTGKPIRVSNLFDAGDGIEEEIPWSETE
ncbi:MAG TPA: hypothetical protein VEK57_26720 [Thermoanaerobaculia bacterium]|nr:hypothetical protein [Thermoanaerobaculia bacterium]